MIVVVAVIMIVIVIVCVGLVVRMTMTGPVGMEQGMAHRDGQQQRNGPAQCAEPKARFVPSVHPHARQCTPSWVIL